ncbi:carboxypeptidase-like regulatory domain-containing protein [Winogradskyella sp. 3972H.M.0a.05]|uniref:carboxypeptidase-like regulatory domain-containing protein n=1 Tax=Winogradskyella sp. 3972H.M.0a.05 TaxID=2950277 RepID=UPI003396FC1B
MKRILCLLLVFTIVFSCNNDDDNNGDQVICTLVFVYGLDVTIIDSSTNAEITEDITVTAIDGTYQEPLMRVDNSGRFFGAGERAGNYTIEVTGEGYQTFTSEVIEVTADQCHVIPQVLEFTITPN